MLEARNERGYVVHLSQDALMELCLAGMEAHIVEERWAKTSKGNRLETFGLLWGGISKMSDGRTLLDVRKATVDTTAVRAKDTVTPSKSAFLLKKDLMTSFWPELTFLGDFHTHPYDEAKCSVTDVEKQRLFEFSDGDFASIAGSRARRRFWAKHGFALGLVATIVKMNREPRVLSDTSRQNRLIFNLGKYRIWLKAYVCYLRNGELAFSGHQERGIQLYCPWVSGYQGPMTDFGADDGKAAYKPGLVVAEMD